MLVLAVCAVELQQEIDPALKAAVDRFLSTQVSEDVDGYLALWSRTAERPQVHQLRSIFDEGDDKFLDFEITRASIDGATARVRLAVTRVRTDAQNNEPGRQSPDVQFPRAVLSRRTCSRRGNGSL